MTSWSRKSTAKIENRAHNNDQLFDKSYEQYIAACNPTSGSQGEMPDMPSAAELISTANFGKPNLNHQFSSEVVMEHTLLPLFKSGFLDETSTKNLTECHPLFHHLQVSLHRLEPMDFSSIAQYNEAFEQQEKIPFPKVMCFAAALLHYDFHIPSVIRYAGNNYTASYRDIDWIMDQLRSVLSPHEFEELERVFKVGSPNKLVATSSRENFLTYWRYGNHSTLEKNMEKVRKVMNKEDRNCYLIPLPCWMTRFIPHLHVTPQGLIVKPGKNDRLVFDGSIKLNWNSHPVNSMTHVKYEPEVTFGQALPKHLIRIWNLRISYPEKDILLWDDDATGAFRQCKLHPDIAQVFSFIIEQLLFVPCGNTFGSNTSPANWEPVRRAREALAQKLFSDSSLIAKHKEYIARVMFCPPPSASVVFTQAFPDSIHTGVRQADGTPVNTPHNMYVDDNLIAEIPARMKQAMAASIEALFILMGFPEPQKRRIAICMEKFIAAMCSYEKQQLGIRLNTRAMVVGMMPNKLAALEKELLHWHRKRKSFNIRQVATLTGEIQHICSVTTWGKYMYMDIQHSVAVALAGNSISLKATSARYKKLEQCIKAERLTSDDDLKAHFALSHKAKMIWSYSKRYFINPSFRENLNILLKLLKSDYQWETPIAFLIPRDPDFTADGDSSLIAAGGYSLHLKFWWHLEWPKEVQARNIREIKRDKKGKLISINILEYITVILNYAASIVAINNLKETGLQIPEHVLVLIKADNTSAECWAKKASSSSVIGKALMRLQAALMIQYGIGINAAYIPGELNTIPDYISRYKEDTNNICTFDHLKQVFPSLTCCHRFHPSKELLSLIYNIVLNTHTLDPTEQIKKLGQFVAE